MFFGDQCSEVKGAECIVKSDGLTEHQPHISAMSLAIYIISFQLIANIFLNTPCESLQKWVVTPNCVVAQ